MTDWYHNRLSVIGKPESIKAFVENAESKDLLWKDGKGPAYLGSVTTLLSFHALVPLRNSTLEGPYDPVGILEERRQWGCKWGAFEPDFQMVEDGHALYEFHTASRPPVNLLKTCSAAFDVKFYVSYWANVLKGRRGRSIYFHHEIYALVNNVSPLTLGSDEDPQNFQHRQELWLHEYFDNHLEWVKEMSA
jgi:hypothetical protein